MEKKEQPTESMNMPLGLVASSKLAEKPPPGPMKRKKKLDKSLVDLTCSAKYEEKRQRISEDKSNGVAEEVPPAKCATTTSTKRGSSISKGKELQNHTLFKLKRKNEEANAALVQRLNACTEQLRLEVNNLKSALLSEKNAVRALR